MGAFVIGIAGGSASGKTTFAEQLGNALADLRVRVIHMDAYFKPEAERPVAARESRTATTMRRIRSSCRA